VFPPATVGYRVFYWPGDFLNLIKLCKMKNKKTTKKLFCSIYDEARKMRKKDPIQFEVMYNEWKRLRQGRI